MIEINLLPGAERKARKSGGGGAGFRLPKLPAGGKLPAFDRMLAFIVGAWILAPALLIWLYLSTSSREQELQVAVQQAQEDSTRYAQVIANVTTLQARRDTIAQKLQIIQELDAGRYVWAHVLDEVARALPNYTWITGIEAEVDAPEPTFVVSGKTANNFALTEFLTQLESSPFVQGVTLLSTEQTPEGQSTVYTFRVQAMYEEPPADAIQSVPLFVAEPEGGDGADTQ